jgi:hypothetical protein
MTVSIEEHLPPVPYHPRILTTVVRPDAPLRSFKSRVMPYRQPKSPLNSHLDKRPLHPEAGQTYTVHSDMSGLKSDLLGHMVDVYA